MKLRPPSLRFEVDEADPFFDDKEAVLDAQGLALSQSFDVCADAGAEVGGAPRAMMLARALSGPRG